MEFKDGDEDVQAYQGACPEGAVIPVPSFLLRNAMAEARPVSDPVAATGGAREGSTVPSQELCEG